MTRGRWLGENGEREVMSLQSRRRLPVWVGVESMTGLKTRRFLPFHARRPPLMGPYFSRGGMGDCRGCITRHFTACLLFLEVGVLNF